MLTEPTGSIYHRMELDGLANICIKTPVKKSASDAAQYRYAIRVQTTDEIPEAMREKPKLDLHLSRIEQEMETITEGMESVLNHARFAQGEYVALFHQFQGLHATTIYWPLVQLCVLIFTGFTQARHIVHFFKKRRIL